MGLVLVLHHHAIKTCCGDGLGLVYVSCGPAIDITSAGIEHIIDVVAAKCGIVSEVGIGSLHYLDIEGGVVRATVGIDNRNGIRIGAAGIRYYHNGGIIDDVQKRTAPDNCVDRNLVAPSAGQKRRIEIERPPENVAVVDTPVVGDLNVPGAIERAANKSAERSIGSEIVGMGNGIGGRYGRSSCIQSVEITLLGIDLRPAIHPWYTRSIGRGVAGRGSVGIVGLTEV